MQEKTGRLLYASKLVFSETAGFPLEAAAAALAVVVVVVADSGGQGPLQSHTNSNKQPEEQKLAKGGRQNKVEVEREGPGYITRERELRSNNDGINWSLEFKR